VRDTKLTKH